MRFNLGVNKVGIHSYAMTGTYDTNGHYHFEGPVVRDTRYAIARIIDLQLDSPTSPHAITGFVTDGTHTSTVELERLATFSASSPAPEQGRYTFLCSDPTLPYPYHGSGFGTVALKNNGRIVVRGRAPDGRIFSQSASLTENGRWPLFAKMAGATNGILSGWLAFRKTVESDFSGPLVWLGQERPGPNNAFVNAHVSTNLSVAGARYTPPPRQPLFQTSATTNDIHLSLSEGGLANTIERNLTLTETRRLIFNPKNIGDALSVKSATGLFTGKFLHPAGYIIPFRGAILQKQNRGGGQFVERSGVGGVVVLTPE